MSATPVAVDQALHPRIDADAAVGAVQLVARDAGALAGWYRTVLGLVDLAADERGVVLGTGEGTPLLALLARPEALPLDRHQPGLYHTAFLLPERADLGRFLRHVSGVGARLSGGSDHLVSEAVYLNDPEGNGVEVYRDRPRSDWPRRGEGVHMDNAPIDVDGIVRAGDAVGEPYGPVPAGTTMGHVHLKVADLDDSRRFYVDGLGFAEMARFPGALFVSAGGYHHHIGLNHWESRGASRRPGHAGLAAASILLPPGRRGAYLSEIAARGIAVSDGSVPSVQDPSGNRLAFLEGTEPAGDLLDPVA